MGLSTEKIVRYYATCDLCGKESEESCSASHEWNESVWKALAFKLKKSGWVYKRTGESGHAHTPTYNVYCSQACYDKVREAQKEPRKSRAPLPRNNGEVGDIKPSGDPICFCGSGMAFRNSDHGGFYGCVKYPKCDGLVGAHKKTGEPLGLPAPTWVRQIRHELHEIFDDLWDNRLYVKKMSRNQAYNWLAEELGIEEHECHIGMFDSETCARAIEAVEKKLAGKEQDEQKKADLKERLEAKARQFRAAKREDHKKAVAVVDDLPPEEDIPF
jgi:ssDNA-binding Zn-finger/Zn-ribbon topoisomerase 1